MTPLRSLPSPQSQLSCTHGLQNQILGQFWMLSLPISSLRRWRNKHRSALPETQHHQHLKPLPYISFPLQFILLFWIKTSLFSFLLVLMTSTDPLLLREMELKLAAKHYEKQSTLKASHPETKYYPGIFQVGSKSLNFFELAAVPWHRLDLT